MGRHQPAAAAGQAPVVVEDGGAHSLGTRGHSTEDIGSLPPHLVSVRGDDHREEDAAAEAHLAQALGKRKHDPEYHNTILPWVSS